MIIVSQEVIAAGRARIKKRKQFNTVLRWRKLKLKK